MLDCHRGLCNAATGCPNCLSLTCGVRGWTRKRSFPLHVPRSPLASAFPAPAGPWARPRSLSPPRAAWSQPACGRAALGRGLPCAAESARREVRAVFSPASGCSDRGRHVLPTFPSLTSCQAHEPPINCSLHKSTKPIFNFFSKLNSPLDWSQSQMIWG